MPPEEIIEPRGADLDELEAGGCLYRAAAGRHRLVFRTGAQEEQEDLGRMVRSMWYAFGLARCP